MPRSSQFAPRLSICSRTTGRTSKPVVTAPSRRAVAIACSPATPAPITSTFAGGTVPAAVMSIGKKRGRCSAPRSAASYPATVACDESASIGCARVIRGTDSSANAVTPRAASASTPVGSESGSRKAINSWPGRSRSRSSGDGLRTFTTPSASHGSPLTAPASVYALSGNEAAAAAGAIIGDNLGYWVIGRWGGRTLFERWGPLRRYADKTLPPTERLMARHGGKVVFFGRFVTVLRYTAAWVAGLAKMAWWRFLF